MDECEEFKRQSIRAENMLRAIYRERGPGRLGGGNGKHPIGQFGRMTKAEVEKHWDFDDRHLMHKLAKVLIRNGVA